MQPTQHPRTSPPGLTVAEHMPRRPSCVCLPEFPFSRSKCDWRSRSLKKLVEVALVSSAPAVVRCAVGVGGAVWVDKHRVIQYSHTASKLYSPDGYRLGITPSLYCIKPTQQNRVVLALQILPTCPIKNCVILALKQSTGTFLSQCPLKTISVSCRTNVLYEYLLSVQTKIKSSSQINTNCHNFRAAKTFNSSYTDLSFSCTVQPF